MSKPTATELSSSEGWGHLARFYYEFRQSNGSFNSQDRARFTEAIQMHNLLCKMNLSGKQVLDAGCGFGYYSFIVAELGGIVTAIDFAPEMIALGQKLTQNHQSRIRFLEADVSDLSQLEEARFDVVVSGMDLDVPDLSHAFAQFARVLKTGGQILFSVPHPILLHGIWHLGTHGERLFYKLDKYFRRGPYSSQWHDERLQPVVFRQYQWALQDYVEALVKNGFVITKLLEAEPSEEFRDTDPGQYDELSRIPAFLIIQGRKTTDPIE